MSTFPTPDAQLNIDVQRLLTQYDCPLKLHEVRAAFMGAIASLYVADPVFELNALWDGAFPELDSEEALKEVQDVFLNQLWSLLAAHAEQDTPFTLTPFGSPASLAEVMMQTRTRGEELDAFMDGFFQDQEDFELDPEAAESLSVLEQLVEMYAEILNMDPTQSTTPSDIEALVENLKKMNEMAEDALNNIILICA